MAGRRGLPRPFRRLASTCLIFIMVAAPGVGPGRLAAASFAEGLAAFDAGDYRAAYDHWRSLAEAGSPPAQVALAGLLESGAPGVGRDHRAAAGWYRKAAFAGDAVAKMNLAQLYAEGRGVRQDSICALAWFTLAADQGRGWAATRRQSVAAAVGQEGQHAASLLVTHIRTAGKAGAQEDPCSDVPAEE
jgi:TPR repeat protein